MSAERLAVPAVEMFQAARVELEDARAERDRKLRMLRIRIERGTVSRIEPDELEQLARTIRTIRLLAQITEGGGTGA